MSEKKTERYSYSKLSSFDTCQHGWYLTYIKKAPKAENAFAAYGTLIHSLMERYERGELKLADLVPVFEWEWNTAMKGLEFPPNKYVDLRKSYYNQALDFLGSFEGLGGCEILGVENEFEIPIDDWVLTGFIDLAFADKNGKFIIRDYKSAKNWTKKDIAEHQRQMYLYSLWVKEKYGRYPDMLQFYHFRTHTTTDIPFAQEGLEDALDWARKTVEKIRSSWIYPHTISDFWCNYICSVRDSCKYRKQSWREKKSK